MRLIPCVDTHTLLLRSIDLLPTTLAFFCGHHCFHALAAASWIHLTSHGTIHKSRRVGGAAIFCRICFLSVPVNQVSSLGVFIEDFHSDEGERSDAVTTHHRLWYQFCIVLAGSCMIPRMSDSCPPGSKVGQVLVFATCYNFFQV